MAKKKNGIQACTIAMTNTRSAVSSPVYAKSLRTHGVQVCIIASRECCETLVRTTIDLHSRLHFLFEKQIALFKTVSGYLIRYTYNEVITQKFARLWPSACDVLVGRTLKPRSPEPTLGAASCGRSCNRHMLSALFSSFFSISSP